jgi:hypothetical protein
MTNSTDYYTPYDLKRHIALKDRSMFLSTDFEVSIGNILHVAYRNEIVSITKIRAKILPSFIMQASE